MEIGKKQKLICKKKNGKSIIEITRHEDPIMDNILVLKKLGKKTENSWIIEKDLESWIKYLETEGYTDIKKIEDVESSKKNNKKNK